MVHVVRLEYLTRDGWRVAHGGIGLLHPDRYVARLTLKGKVGRATDIHTGEVWMPEVVPDPSEMHPSGLLPGFARCPYCASTDHERGECLI